MKPGGYKLTVVTAMAAMLSACAPPQVPQTPPPNNQPRMNEPKMMLQPAQGLSVVNASSADAPLQLQVDLYQLLVPYGTVSRNEQFWKRVDEQCVDVATYDLLFKNGVRVGEAPIAEWEYFRAIMERHPAITKANTLVGAEGKPFELPLRKQVSQEDIFYFDSTNQLQGRTYPQSENVIAMTIQSAPRKADTLRLALCPLVRATRKRLEYSAMNAELGEVSYAAPERIYDVNLRVDVPAEHFLIVAPSGESTWSTSIGNSFFISDGAAEKMETVLLIVPKPVRLVETKTPAR